MDQTAVLMLGMHFAKLDVSVLDVFGKELYKA